MNVAVMYLNLCEAEWTANSMSALVLIGLFGRCVAHSDFLSTTQLRILRTLVELSLWLSCTEGMWTGPTATTVKYQQPRRSLLPTVPSSHKFTTTDFKLCIPFHFTYTSHLEIQLNYIHSYNTYIYSEDDYQHIVVVIFTWLWRWLLLR